MPNPNYREKRLGELIRFEYDWSEDLLARPGAEILVSEFASTTLTLSHQEQDGPISRAEVSGGAAGINVLTLSAETQSEQLVKKFTIYGLPGTFEVSQSVYYWGVGAPNTDPSTLTAHAASEPYGLTVMSPENQACIWAWPASWGEARITLGGLDVDLKDLRTTAILGTVYNVYETTYRLTGDNLVFRVETL